MAEMGLTVEKTNVKKRIIFLLCGIVAIFLVALAFWAYQKVEEEPMEYVKRHKEEWIDLLTNDYEVLLYLEQLYTVGDDLTISYRNGELIINRSASDMFSSNELKKLEEYFKTFQWETIRLREQENAERKVLEVISQQIIIGNFFRKHYGVAILVYSQNDNQYGGEEIFPGWYYGVLFNT